MDGRTMVRGVRTAGRARLVAACALAACLALACVGGVHERAWASDNVSGHAMSAASEPDLSIYVDLGTGPGETPHWAVESGVVSRALSAGIMSGYADPETGALTGYFGPDDLTTRGQAARILYNMAHANGLIADDSYYENRANRAAILSKFDDVDVDSFYAASVAWATDMKIITGYDKTSLFGPADSLTREQYAVIAYRFARACAADLTGAGSASFAKAPDAAEVSTWAADAMGWCAANKIITGIGDTGVLNPSGTATRAEICKISVLALDAIAAR